MKRYFVTAQQLVQIVTHHFNLLIRPTNGRKQTTQQYNKSTIYLRSTCLPPPTLHHPLFITHSFSITHFPPPTLHHLLFTICSRLPAQHFLFSTTLELPTPCSRLPTHDHHLATTHHHRLTTIHSTCRISIVQVYDHAYTEPNMSRTLSISLTAATCFSARSRLHPPLGDRRDTHCSASSTLNQTNQS